MQYAVWTWYDDLLNSYDPYFLQGWGGYAADLRQERPSPPLVTLKTLLANGADFYSGSTVLDGLVHNNVQFDRHERPLEVLEACMSTWLQVVQELGFDLKEYLRHEAEYQKDRYYHMGVDIHMRVCFNEDSTPHIWTIFQGPEEREQNVFVDSMSKCARWKEWRLRYAIPKPPFELEKLKLLKQSVEYILVARRCECPSIGPHPECCYDPELNLPKELGGGVQTGRKASRTVLWYIISAMPYRQEFTFYVFILVGFFGCSYCARFWLAGGFYLALKLFQDATLSWL
jgi:hypothetical protein